MRKFQKNICFGGWVIAGSKHALTILFTSFILMPCSDGQDTNSTESGTSGLNQSLKIQTVIDDNALSNESDAENWLAFGRTHSEQTFEKTESLYITGTPKIFKGKGLIGNGGTETGPNRDYVTAYDVETGEQAWRFYIVPGNPADSFEIERYASVYTSDRRSTSKNPPFY